MNKERKKEQCDIGERRKPKRSQLYCWENESACSPLLHSSSTSIAQLGKNILEHQTKWTHLVLMNGVLTQVQLIAVQSIDEGDTNDGTADARSIAHRSEHGRLHFNVDHAVLFQLLESIHFLLERVVAKGAVQPRLGLVKVHAAHCRAHHGSVSGRVGFVRYGFEIAHKVQIGDARATDDFVHDSLEGERDMAKLAKWIKAFP